MNSVDLTPLFENDIEFSEIKTTVEERFKCKWDDAVHDSYSLYVKQIVDRAESIHSIRSKAEEIAILVERLNVDKLFKEADSLCSEADSV